VVFHGAKTPFLRHILPDRQEYYAIVAGRIYLEKEAVERGRICFGEKEIATFL
jgi:hypothetical protein